jgi:hypothetical protein
MNADLAAFQHAFWQDLWAPEPTDPRWAAQPGFAVYRNTVRTACIDTLLAQYPAVRRLVGDDALRAIALAHVLHHPPDDGRLLVYGAQFAAQLAALASADGDLPWLVDVAWLDRLWTECHVAPDGPVLPMSALATLPPDTLDRTRLVPHPAARWRWSAAWPAFDLWAAARDGRADPNPTAWVPQGALLTRPHDAVQHCALDAAGCALLEACAQGMNLPEALAHAQAADPLPDLGATLALLLAQGAFSEIRDEHTDPTPRLAAGPRTRPAA